MDGVTLAPAVRILDDVDDSALAARQPYATAAYGRAAATATPSCWMAAGADGWRLPFLLSPDGDEAASPTGYPGLWIADAPDSGRFAALWAASVEALAGLGTASLFLRLPPFAPEQAGLLRAVPGVEVRHAADTVLVRADEEEVMWSRMVPAARRQVRKAERAGLSTSLERFDADAPDVVRRFRAVYDPTMVRLEAPPQLRFGDAYYALLAGGLGPNLLVARVTDGDRDLASCLLMDDGRLLHYHLSGSTGEGAAAGANNLMIWSAMRAARALGREGVHLGGGRPSLLRFKRSFGGEQLPFEVAAAIVDADRYERLVGRRARALGTSVEALERSGYFPAYRATPTALPD